VPSQYSSRDLPLQPVRFLELSRDGARIELPDLLNAGLLCVIDLPPALGRGTLSGQIVWIMLHQDE